MSAVAEVLRKSSQVQPGQLDVPQALLQHLRTVTGTPDLAYASPPALIPGGNETVIWGFELRDAPPPFAGPLILRAYVRGDRLPHQAEWEAAAHNALADAGYPVPRVHDCGASDALGGAFAIMERAPGVVMGREVLSGLRMLHRLPALLREIPRALADEHLALHAVDPAPLRQRLEDPKFPQDLFTVAGWLDKARKRMMQNDHAGLRPAVAWLEAHQPPPAAAPVICHGDFHPLNILRDGGRVTGVIDWSKVLIADREFDVGNTLAILTLTRIHLPALVQPLMRRSMRTLAKRYVSAYTESHALDAARLDYGEAVRIGVELANYDAHLPRRPGAMQPTGGAGGWDYHRLVNRFHELTGLRLQHAAVAGRG